MTAIRMWVDRDLIEATGSEAESYLHGQVSQSVSDMAVGESRWSFLLEPQGKVEGFFRITRVGPERFLLDTDAGAGEAIQASLDRFKLRTDVRFDLRLVSMVQVRGVPADTAPTDGATVLPFAWPGIDGYDLIVGDVDDETLDEIGELLPADEAERWRIQHGVPAMGYDITPGTIPNETGAVELACSFVKGCYRGQELVERIAARGAERFVLRRLDIAGPPPNPGTPILADGDEVGRVTSSVAADGGSSALGYVRGAIEVGRRLSIDGREANSLPLL